MKNQSIIDGKRVFKATNVSKIDPVYLELAEGLSVIDSLNYIKIYKNRLRASNLLCDNGKKDPLIKTGKKDVVGLELLINPASKTIEFSSIESFPKGHGRKMVASVVDVTPDDWSIGVATDWIDGFFKKMIEEYPRIVNF